MLLTRDYHHYIPNNTIWVGSYAHGSGWNEIPEYGGYVKINCNKSFTIVVILLLCLYIEKEYSIYLRYILNKDKHMKIMKHIHTYLISSAALFLLIVLTAGCATAPPVEQTEPRVPELPPRPGISVSETEVLQEPATDEPVSVVTPVLPREPEVSAARPIQEAPADAEPLQETVEADPVEEAPEEPAVVEAEEPEVEEEAAETEQPVIAETEPEPAIVQAEPEPETQDVVVYPQGDRIEEAQKELEDRNSTAVILSWFGIPILVIMAIILLIEMIRYLVFNKPLFAWAGIERTHDDMPPKRAAQFFQDLKGRIKKLFSRINEKLDEPEDEDYFFETDKQEL